MMLKNDLTHQIIMKMIKDHFQEFKEVRMSFD